MSALKGFSSQKRIQKEHFSSIVPIDNNRAGLDVLPKAVYPVSTANTAEAITASNYRNTKNPELRIVKSTGHSARKGDVLRFTTGDNLNIEVPVEIVDGDIIYLGGELLADPTGDDFSILRHLTLTINSDGELEVAQGPTSFVKDGSTVEVTEDTVDSSNNVPLPVKLTGVTGDVSITAQDLDVQSTHTGANPDSIQIGDGTETVNVNASNELQVRDDDANTTLTSLDGKDYATSAKQDTVITELQKLTAQATNKRVVDSEFTSSAIIPTASRLGSVTVPASTKAVELEALCKSGDSFSAYDAATGGNLLGTFTQAGGRIPVNLSASTQIYFQSNTGSNITAELVVNLIGVDA